MTKKPERIPRKHPVDVVAGPVTHWGASETAAWAQRAPGSSGAFDVYVQNPRSLSTASMDQMARREGTTIVLRLTRRQLSAWLKEAR